MLLTKVGSLVSDFGKALAAKRDLNAFGLYGINGFLTLMTLAGQRY